MEVDFYFQLLRRFHPQVLTQTLRGTVRSFIKQTNLDTYQCLCQIYDFVATGDPNDQVMIRCFAREMRERVDKRSKELRAQGERIQRRLGDAYERRDQDAKVPRPTPIRIGWPFEGCKPVPYRGLDSVRELEFVTPEAGWEDVTDLFGIAPTPILYQVFKSRLEQQEEERR